MLGALLRAKAIWEWVSFANEALTAIGVLKRMAAGAAVVATVAAVPAAINAAQLNTTTNQAAPTTRAQEASTPGPTYIDPQSVQVWKEESGKVYHASYLINNREVLAYILATCKNGTENNMARCEQASNAEQMIYSEQQRRRINSALGR
jgi:hypothetical protein